MAAVIIALLLASVEPLCIGENTAPLFWTTWESGLFRLGSGASTTAITTAPPDDSAMHASTQKANSALFNTMVAMDFTPNAGVGSPQPGRLSPHDLSAPAPLLLFSTTSIEFYINPA